jgi:hypothetical protein
MRVRRGDNRCPGDSKPGLIAVHKNSYPRLVRFRTGAASRARKSNERRAARQPHSGHRSTLGCTSDIDEGATRRAAFHRATPLRTKAGRGKRCIRTGARARTERVRECDLIKCCVASPPRCRAIGIVFRQSDVERSTKRSRENVRLARVGDEKGEGTSGRGSSVAFTRYEVSRSRPTKRLSRERKRPVRMAAKATGVSDVARVPRLGGKKTPAPSESRDHGKRATAS